MEETRSMDKTSKKLISIAVGLLLLAAAYALIEMANPGNAEKTSVSASWSDHYRTVEDMVAQSDLCIIGVVVSSGTELRNGMVFTRNHVEIQEVISGNLEAGETIDVLQTGGQYGSITTPPISDAPLMDQDSSYALCLRQTKPHWKYGQYYLVMGGYQGMAALPASSNKQESTFNDYFRARFESE